MIGRENINQFWASLIVEELVRHNIIHFCISPGSRSAPLALAAARHPDVQEHLCPDERGAAFWAVGYGKASVSPAVLICTSGTAGANYYPGILEAAMDNVPLIVLTADRPPELQDIGANQTIRQANLYSSFVRWSFPLPPPDEQIDPLFVLTTIDQAVYRACSQKGPVHINCMFREPLAPTSVSFHSPEGNRFNCWQKDKSPLTRYSIPVKQVTDSEFQHLVNLLRQTEKGLILLGRFAASGATSELSSLLESMQWPVYADISSGFRLGRSSWPIFPEAALLSKVGRSAYQPETVLHFGGKFVSKQLKQWLTTVSLEHYIHVENDPRRIDPDNRITWRIDGDVSDLCRRLLLTMEHPSPFNTHGKFSDDLDLSLESGFNMEHLTEPHVAFLISKLISKDHSLFLGNSMPVRDMNLYASYLGCTVPVGTNRGVSGIDGTLASAVGFSCGLDRPATVVTGDLAFLHDLNSLWLIKQSKHPIIVVCINNDGGGIFSFLPITQVAKEHSHIFETPHGLDLVGAAALFGISGYKTSTAKEFTNTYQMCCQNNQSAVIQITTNKTENVRDHQTINKHLEHYFDGRW